MLKAVFSLALFVVLALAQSQAVKNQFSCQSLSGGTCKLEKLADFFGVKGLFSGCDESQECQFGACACKMGTCWDSVKEACVPWKGVDVEATRPNADKILCPVLASLYNAGILNPDRFGRITQDELKFALHHGAGAHLWAAQIQSGIAAYHEKDLKEKIRDRCSPISICGIRKLLLGQTLVKDVRYLNIFKMGQNHLTQHGFSTGVREVEASDPNNECKGVFPCEKRFNEFWVKFARQDGRLYRAEIANVICNAKKNGDKRGEFSNATLRVLREWQMKAAVFGFLEGIGRRDEENNPYFTVEDLRSLLMDGHFYPDWVRRSWGTKYSVYMSVRTPLPCPDDRSVTQGLLRQLSGFFSSVERMLPRRSLRLIKRGMDMD